MREEIRQNMRQNETELICYGRNGVADKHRRQWSKHRRAGAPPTCTQPIQGKWAHSQSNSKGVIWWWGEKMVYIWFPAMTSFGNMPCWDGILPKISNKWLGPFDTCHRAR